MFNNRITSKRVDDSMGIPGFKGSRIPAIVIGGPSAGFQGSRVQGFK